MRLETDLEISRRNIVSILEHPIVFKNKLNLVYENRPRQIDISNCPVDSLASGCILVLSSDVESDVTMVHLPKELAERIRRRLKDSDFKSMDDYVAYVLSQILDEIEGAKPKTEEVFSAKEQGDVEEHLRSLGYM